MFGCFVRKKEQTVLVAVINNQSDKDLIGRLLKSEILKKQKTGVKKCLKKQK